MLLVSRLSRFTHEPMPPSSSSFVRRHVSERIRLIMAHTTRYAFDGCTRLAQDIGVHPATLSRVLSGKRSPSFALMCALAAALEQELGRSLDPRELLTFSGSYPTPSVCELCGCRGCAYSPQAKKSGRKARAEREDSEDSNPPRRQRP